MCVCFGGEGSERIWNKFEKGKGLEDERRLSVYEHPLAICARVGVATVLAYARVTHHGTYLQSLYTVYSKLFVQRNSIPTNKMLTKSKLHKSCGC